MKRFLKPAEIDLAQVILVDCDLEPAYNRCHLPGAHHAHCRYWKEEGSDEGIHGIESSQILKQLTSSWGLHEDSQLVAYDSSGGLNATRLGWTLERFGFHNTVVLDGGLNAWLEAGRPVTQEPPSKAESTFHFTEPNSKNLTRIEQLKDLEAVLWDDRSLNEWNRGIIPGGVHLEWTEVLDAKKRLLPDQELRKMLEPLGIIPDKPVCVYCQGGIRASHSYWVLKHLGYEDVTVYDGSWAEYSVAIS